MRLTTPLVLAAALALAGRPSSAQGAAAAEWTVMVYMDADCDLEVATLPDLEEMLAAGSTDQVNIVALVDRAQGGDEEKGLSDAPVANLPNWTTAKLLYVEKGRLRELADWGEVNMAAGPTLARFLETVRRDYPARSYALILGDHGGGWPGLVADHSAPHDILTMDEIRGVLGPLLKEQPLDLLGFDACLMGNYETALSMSPLARVLVASEEVEPGVGWEYTTPLRALGRKPTMSGAELGRLIADSVMAFYTGSPEEEVRNAGLGVTLSVVSLDKLGAVESTLGRLADEMAKGLATSGRALWLKIAEARTQTEEYGTLSDPDEPSLGLYDLRDFALQLDGQVAEPALKAAASEVAKAVDTAVVHRVRGEARPSANGLSVFFPRDAEMLGEGYAKVSVANRGRWLPFLKAFAGITDADHDAPDLGAVDATARNVTHDKPIKVRATVKADDVDEAYFVLSEVQGEESYVIGQVLVEPDDQGKLEDEWDGDWFTIGTRSRRVVAPITSMEPAAEEAEDEQEEEESGEPARGVKGAAAAKPAAGDTRQATRVDAVGSRGEDEEEDEEAAEDTEGKDASGQGDEGEADQSVYVVEVPVEVARKGSDEFKDVNLYFYVDFDQDEIKGTFMYAFEDVEEGPKEYKLKPGEKVRPVYLRVKEDGDQDYVVSYEPEDLITLGRGAADLTVEMARVAEGDYRVGFDVWDYAGNVDEHAVDVKVK